MPSSQVRNKILRFKGLMTIGEQGDLNAFAVMNKLKS